MARQPLISEVFDAFADDLLAERSPRPLIIKLALASTLPLHNDGAARRVSERIESCFHAQTEFL